MNRSLLSSAANRVRCAAALAAIVAAGCGAANPPQAARNEQGSETPASTAAQPAMPKGESRLLPGAVAAAFDPSRPRLAWTTGEDIRVLDLRTGAEDRRAADGDVSDLGFAPDGSLWVVGARAQRWQDGSLACETQDLDLDRLLALDDQGAVAAGYSHSDGVGMLRQQVWLDAQCGIAKQDNAPLPAGVADAEHDPGAPFGRESLRPPRALAPNADGTDVSDPDDATLAVSPDGRWRVTADSAGLRLSNASSSP